MTFLDYVKKEGDGIAFIPAHILFSLTFSLRTF